MASCPYPIQLLHLPGGGGGQAAVTFLCPQEQSIILYAAGPDGEQRQRIVFVYPILPATPSRGWTARRCPGRSSNPAMSSRSASLTTPLGR
ncbi:unnamed protein product [Urochloa humidicola]